MSYCYSIGFVFHFFVSRRAKGEKLEQVNSRTVELDYFGYSIDLGPRLRIAGMTILLGVAIFGQMG